MNLRRIDLNLLVIFDALMTEPSVTRAAQKVGVSQSAMSHAIGRIRRALNDDVVRRTPNGLVPTQRARQLAGRMNGLLREIGHALDEQLNFDPKTSERSFRIRLTPYACACLMPRLIARVRREAPALTLYFDHLPVPGGVDSDAGDIQIRICSQPPLAAGLVQKRLLVDSLVVAMRPDHPAAKGELTLDAFLALPHVGGTGVIAGTALFDRALAHKGLQRRIVATTPSWPEVIPTILDSDVVAVLPRPWLGFFIDPDQLAVRPLPAAVAMPFTVEMISHARDDRDAGHRWLRRAAEEEFHNAHERKFPRFRAMPAAA